MHCASDADTSNASCMLMAGQLMPDWVVECCKSKGPGTLMISVPGNKALRKHPAEVCWTSLSQCSAAHVSRHFEALRDINFLHSKFSLRPAARIANYATGFRAKVCRAGSNLVVQTFSKQRQVLRLLHHDARAVDVYRLQKENHCKAA